MKTAIVMLLAACLAVSGAAGHPVRNLLQGAASTQGGGVSNLQALVSAPATEAMLAPFELELTPTAEVQSDSSMLMQTLSNPTQFGQQVAQMLARTNGLTTTAAAFSDILARGMASQLVMAINQADTSNAFTAGGAAQGAAPVAAAAGGTSNVANAVHTAFALAVVDQISRRHFTPAAQAVWWSVGGAGGADLARAVTSEMASFEARNGCSAPLRPVLLDVGNLAQSGGGGAAAGAGMASVQNLVSNMQQQPQLFACFSDAFPGASSLAAGAAPTTGATTTTPTTTTTAPTTGTTTTGATPTGTAGATGTAMGGTMGGNP